MLCCCVRVAKPPSPSFKHKPGKQASQHGRLERGPLRDAVDRGLGGDRPGEALRTCVRACACLQLVRLPAVLASAFRLPLSLTPKPRPTELSTTHLKPTYKGCGFTPTTP